VHVLPLAVHVLPLAVQAALHCTITVALLQAPAVHALPLAACTAALQ